MLDWWTIKYDCLSFSRHLYMEKNCKSFFLQMLSKDGNWVSSLAKIASYPLSVKVRKWVNKWTNTWAMWSKPSENPFHTSFTLTFRTLSLTSQGIKFWRKNVSLQFWLFSNLFFFPCICFIFFFSFFFSVIMFQVKLLVMRIASHLQHWQSEG